MTANLLQLNWEVIIAGGDDVARIVQSLSGHMDAGQRERFRDKLDRYVRKPDRDLLIAVEAKTVLGFYTVIEHDDLPTTLPLSMRDRLRDFACCTGLLVHPDRRRRGIGASLHRRGEKWAGERGKRGLWLSTRRHAGWYQRHFGYEEVARVMVKGIERTIMAKTFES